jgi:hypothetical protein
VTIVLDESERRNLRQKARKATLAALHALGGEARREAIREWALTNGGFSARERAASPPPIVAQKYPTLVDHDLSWALTNLKRDGLVENPSWSVWRSTAVLNARTVSAVDAPIGADRLAELRAMPYRIYLRTPEWRRTRAAALVRAGNACSLDVRHTEELEVHHRTYERLGAELVSDLIVLCHSCHRLHHKQYGRAPKRRAPKTPTTRRAASRMPTESMTATLIAEKRQQRRRSLLSRLLGT